MRMNPHLQKVQNQEKEKLPLDSTPKLTSFHLLWSGFALLGIIGQNNQKMCLDCVNVRLYVVSVVSVKFAEKLCALL